MKRTMVSYTTVKIPDPLLEEVERIVKSYQKLSYRNRSEFIVEAIREKILRLNDLERKS